MRFLAIQLKPLTQKQHQCTDKYTYNTSSCKIGIIENSRYHPFHSEGSPLLYPVALLIIKLQCENIIKSRKFLKNISYTLNKSPGYQVTCCIQYYFSAICFASKP